MLFLRTTRITVKVSSTPPPSHNERTAVKAKQDDEDGEFCGDKRACNEMRNLIFTSQLRCIYLCL